MWILQNPCSFYRNLWKEMTSIQLFFVCLDHTKKMFIAIKIAQAIAYLHNLTPAIVHRDIKLATILVEHNALILKLCDLGISIVKQRTTIITMVSVVDADRPPGTAYIPPELLLSGRYISTTDEFRQKAYKLINQSV